MPRRRRPPSSPFDDFFDKIIETVVERVDATITPMIEELSEQVVETVQIQVDHAIRRGPGSGSGSRSGSGPGPGSASTPRPERPRTRRRASGQSTHPPPPPPPQTPPKRPEPTLYDVLQVSRTADPETIRAAYKALAAKYHPDNQATGNTDRMRQVNAAWEVLKDTQKRREYDRTLQ